MNIIEAKKVVRILSVLDNEIRLKILFSLKDKVKMTFLELYRNVFLEKISKDDLNIHLRLLYISGLIRNDGYSENAEFKITPYGNSVLNALEEGHELSKAICNK